MARIEIAQLVISNRVADKLWSHGLVAEQVRAVLRGHHVVGRNRTDVRHLIFSLAATSKGVA